MEFRKDVILINAFAFVSSEIKVVIIERFNFNMQYIIDNIKIYEVFLFGWNFKNKGLIK